MNQPTAWRALGARRSARVALAAALFTPAIGPAVAAPATTSAAVQVTPTLETAGIRVFITGDDNNNASGALQYRAAGQSAWSAGHPLVRTAPGRLSSLLFNLREGAAYEARVTVTDPDGGGASATAAFSTRATPRQAASGRTLTVAPNGSISAALATARPGDTIVLLPGTYRERVINTSVSGTASAPITIRAAAPGVYLRGDLPGPAEPHAAALWRRQPDGLYATPAPGRSAYVAAGDARLYHYASRAALAAGPHPGWWQDADGTVYVKLAGGASPDTLPMHIAQLQEPFLLDGVHDLILEGLDIAYFGAQYGHGIYLRNASDVTVRNCRIRNVPDAVFLKGDCRNNLIEGNDLADIGMADWPWSAVKGTDMENVGVSIVEGGSGNVVRRNRIHGMFNALACTTGPGAHQGDTDVYNNWIGDVGDDGLEPEGHNINFRAWCNTVSGAQNTVSLAPVTEGPVWLLFNVLTGFRETGLKIGNNTAGAVLAYHNTIVTVRPDANALSPWTSFANVALRHNILMATRYVIEDYYAPAGRGVSLDGDLLYTTDAGRFVKWRGVRYAGLADLRAGAGLEAAGIAADSRFINAAAGDFRLGADSPARRAARPIPGITDFLGATPDIGAYQMG